MVVSQDFKHIKESASKRNTDSGIYKSQKAEPQVNKVERVDLVPNTTKIVENRFKSPMMNNKRLHSRRYSQNEVESNLNFDPK